MQQGKEGDEVLKHHVLRCLLELCLILEKRFMV